jgi:hypothetical protein
MDFESVVSVNRKVLAILPSNRQEVHSSVDKCSDACKRISQDSNVTNKDNPPENSDQADLPLPTSLSPRNEAVYGTHASNLLKHIENLEYERNSAQEVRIQLEDLIESYESQYPVSDSSVSDSISVWMLSPSTAAAAFSETESVCSVSVECDLPCAHNRENFRRDLDACVDDIFESIPDPSFAENAEVRGFRRGSFCEWIVAPIGTTKSSSANQGRFALDEEPGHEFSHHSPCASIAALRCALIGESFSGGGCSALSGWCSAIGVACGEDFMRAPMHFDSGPSLHRKTETCASWILL